MKKSKNRAALRPLKLLIYPIGILPVASRHSENLRRRLGNILQFRTAATDHNSSSELLRLKIIAEPALDDLKNLFGARRRDPVDRQTRNLTVADRKIAVEPDLFVFIIGGHSSARMLDFYLFRLRMTDSQTETQIIGDMIATDRQRSGAHGDSLLIKHPITDSTSDIDHENATSPFLLGRYHHSRSETRENQIVDVERESVDDMDRIADFRHLSMDGPITDFQPFSLQELGVGNKSSIEPKRLPNMVNHGPVRRKHFAFSNLANGCDVVPAHGAVDGSDIESALIVKTGNMSARLRKIDAFDPNSRLLLSGKNRRVRAIAGLFEIGDVTFDDPLRRAFSHPDNAQTAAIDDIADQNDDFRCTDFDGLDDFTFPHVFFEFPEFLSERRPDCPMKDRPSPQVSGVGGDCFE